MKEVRRAQVCQRATLETPAQVDEYLAALRKQLLESLEGNDAIRLMADRVVRLRDGAIRSNETNAVKVPAQDLEW